MKNYLFNISEEEKQNILDRHKTLYDGYAVRQNIPNTQPLYTQDFANDKEGITVNSKGDVSTYNNKIYMKESQNICSECGLYEEVCECGKGGMNETKCSECGGMMTEGECSECGYKKVEGIGDKFDYVDEYENLESEMFEMGDLDEVLDEVDESMDEKEVEDLKESIQESLNWFKKFKNYN